MLVTVVTGAGVSRSAGLKTYREEGSQWVDSDLEALSHSSCYGNHLQQLNPHWWALATQMAEAEPTPFHHYVASQGWRVITQNVDGLHQKAGSTEVLELHGSMLTWTDLRGRRPVPHTALQWSDEEGWQHPTTKSSRVRPATVLFGEKVKEGRKAEEWVRRSDLVLYAGTSGNVYPVADWYRIAPKSVLVDPKPWGSFTQTYALTSDAWVGAGAPLL